jgi:hypothetical protein
VSQDIVISDSMTARAGGKDGPEAAIDRQLPLTKMPRPAPAASLLLPTAARHTSTLSHLREFTCDRRYDDFLDERELGVIAAREVGANREAGARPLGFPVR